VPDHRASSVYSQPGPETLRIVSHDSDRMLSVYSEVSPLTSPRASADFDHADSPDVSPIEPRRPVSHELPTFDPKLRSQLPILQKAPATADSDAGESRAPPGWRQRSAEGAQDGQTTPPLELSKEERLVVLREKNRKLLSGFQEQRSTKSKAVTNPPRNDSLDHPVYREPWKGASGRTPLVDPVRNVPRSKNDPRPVAKKKNPGKDLGAHAAVTVPAIRTTSTERTSSPASGQPDVSAESADEPMKPIVPLKLGNNTPRVRSPMTAENLSGPFNPRYSDATVSSYENGRSEIAKGSRDDAQVTSPTPAQQKPSNSSSDTLDRLRPKTSENESASRFSWTTSATTTPPPKTPENDISSRFSWTTYATSVHESPRTMAQRGSHPPPVPPVPYMPNAMAMRKRPIPSHSMEVNSNSKSKINRKPTPSDVTRERSSSLHSTPITTSEAQKSATPSEAQPADRSKSLPQCPPELEAKDRIGALEARMDALNRRRRNITQILKELSSVVQPTTFTYDLATREEVKKTVKGLEDELSEIWFEESQIGMTLHRILKKRDQENVYGYPTGLWIKRVTS
jgi:hypothetical protein